MKTTLLRWTEEAEARRIRDFTLFHSSNPEESAPEGRSSPFSHVVSTIKSALLWRPNMGTGAPSPAPVLRIDPTSAEMTWKTLAVAKQIAQPGDERVALQLSPSTSNSFQIVPVLLALLLLVGPMRSAIAELRSVEANGTEFKVTVSDGTVLFSPDLVGAQLVIAVASQRVQLRIVAVERDPDAKQGEV
jgi:hypothetical protein